MYPTGSFHSQCFDEAHVLAPELITVNGGGTDLI